MKSIYLSLAFTAFFASSSVLSAQESALPKVFILGEEEQVYEALTREYEETLLGACDGNMELAVEKWLGMMKEMESYAKKIRFELKGIKLWIHVFWDTDGSLKHIGFRLRPDSRNVRPEELGAFLSSFMNRYKFPVAHEKKYAHYVGATFPTFLERVEK
jgi:hypothetical protein